MRRPKKAPTHLRPGYRDPAAAAAVTAMHPGPGPNYRPPAPLTRDPADRLAIAERDLLELAIEKGASRSGRMGDLARLVIVRRAEAGRNAINV